MERHEYKRYLIFVEADGRGWKTMIRPPNIQTLIPGPSGANKKTVLAEAKDLIDRGAI